MQKNCWLIEHPGEKNHFVEAELNSLDKLGKNHLVFKMPYFTTWISPLEKICQNENVDNFIMRCGTTALFNIYQTENFSEWFHPEETIVHNQAIIEKADFWLAKIKQSIFYDVNNFDQKNYQNLGLPLLNDDSEFVMLSQPENLQLSFDDFRFIKPTRDLKAFNAGVLNAGETIEQFLNSQTHDGSYEQETLMISSAKNVMDEYRFFVAGDKVIASSQYRHDKQLEYRALDNSVEHQKVLAVAHEYAKLYAPAEIFVMDIAREDNNRYSIIEYNSFNCAGLYAANHQAVINEVEGYLETHRYSKKLKP